MIWKIPMIRKFLSVVLLTYLCTSLSGCSTSEKSETTKKCPNKSEVLAALETMRKQFGDDLSQDIFDLHQDWDSSITCREKIVLSYIALPNQPQSSSQSKKATPLDLKTMRTGFDFTVQDIQRLKKADFIVPHQIEMDQGMQFMKFSETHHPSLVILYFHGGGYVLKYENAEGLYLDFLSKLSRNLNADIYVPFYRVRPEHSLMASLNDAYKAYRILVHHKGINPNNIVVIGDSAGGGLSLRLLLALRNKKEKMPKMAVLISPWSDLTNSGKSFIENANKDIFSNSEMIKSFTKSVLGKSNPKNPMISPLFGNYTGFPKLLYVVSGSEAMRDDTLRDIVKARKQGVDAELIQHEDVPHVYPALARFLKSGQEAVNQIIHKIKLAYSMPH